MKPTTTITTAIPIDQASSVPSKAWTHIPIAATTPIMIPNTTPPNQNGMPISYQHQSPNHQCLGLFWLG
jgi:hypothetical protein